MWGQTGEMESGRVTYVELAKALGIKLASARRLAARRKWPRRRDLDGATRIQVPAKGPSASAAPSQVSGQFGTLDSLNRELSSLVAEWETQAAHIEDLWRRRAKFEAQQAVLHAEWERFETARVQQKQLREPQSNVTNEAVQRLTSKRLSQAARCAELSVKQAELRTPRPRRLQSRAA